MRDSITYDPNPAWLRRESTTDDIVLETVNSEDMNWLKLSESAFRFWDNPVDEKWEEV